MKANITENNLNEPISDEEKALNKYGIITRTKKNKLRDFQSVFLDIVCFLLEQKKYLLPDEYEELMKGVAAALSHSTVTNNSIEQMIVDALSKNDI